MDRSFCPDSHLVVPDNLKSLDCSLSPYIEYYFAHVCHDLGHTEIWVLTEVEFFKISEERKLIPYGQAFFEDNLDRNCCPGSRLVRGYLDVLRLNSTVGSDDFLCSLRQYF